MATISTCEFYGKKKKVPKLVLIPRGDVSDVDIDSSDDEEEEVFARTRKTREECASENPARDIGLEVEMENFSDDEDAGEDADSSTKLPQVDDRTKKSSKKKAQLWTHDDILSLQAEYNEEFGSPPDELPSPYQYFKLFCDNSAFQNFADQTNLYSVQTTGNCAKTTAKEMEQFVGIHVISGIVKMPSYKNYWSVATRFSTVADVMPRNRFSKLRTLFHVNDNSYMTAPTHPDHERLFKVRPLLKRVSENMAKVEPEEFNAVDEMIIPFKGRCALNNT